MAVRVLIPGLDAEEFDLDIEASAEGRKFRVGGPEVDAFKSHLDGQGGGWATCRFDVSCDLGTLRECLLVSEGQGSQVVLVCSNVEPPAPSS